MVRIEVTKVILTRGDDWALVKYRSINASGTFGGKFGCNNARIVPGQYYTGNITSKRDRSGQKKTSFNGHPLSREAHALKAAFKHAGITYPDRSALFSTLKLKDLLFALENQKHSRLMSVPKIGRKKVARLYTAFEQVKGELSQSAELGRDYPQLCKYVNKKQMDALLAWKGSVSKLTMQIRADPWRVVYDNEYDTFGAWVDDKRNDFIKATTTRSRLRMVKSIQTDMGLSDNDPRAKRCAAIHVIKTHMTNTGDYWMPLRRFFALTGASGLEPTWPCVVRDNYVALGRFAGVESFLQDTFSSIESNYEQPTWSEPPADALLDEDQREAVRLACTSPLFILQGGAGVGKTTVCKHIVSALRNDVSCAAPTGKAAQRLAEVTGAPAYTVHRMAYMSENIPLSSTLLLDEQSMQEPEILARLLVKRTFQKIIFVGDTGQLTSVGPGQFLRDLCASDMPRKELTHIYRADATSFIASNGQKIRDGDDALDTSPESFVVLPYMSDQAIISMCADVYTNTNKMPMVLCNTNGEVASLNGPLRQICNPIMGVRHTKPVNLDYQGSEWRYPEWRFGQGDSVINIKNKYTQVNDNPATLEVANGEIGTVANIMDRASGQCMMVRFTNVSVTYNVLDEAPDYLRPAYALTVNKAQGSEYDVVLVKSAATWGDKRERFYTAITRAKKKCVVFEVGNANAVCIATPKAIRKTFLLK